MALQELAREDVKPFGRVLHAIHTDAQGQPDAFEGEAVRLSKVNKVVALYGGQNAAQVQRLERARVPLVTPASVSPRQVGEVTFAIGLTPAFRGKALAQFVVEKKMKHVAIVLDERYEDGAALVEAFQGRLKPSTDDPEFNVVSVRFGKEAKYVELAKRVTDADASAMLFVGNPTDFATLIRELASNPPVLLYGGDEGSLRSETVSAPVVLVTAFAVDPELPRTDEFAKKFRETFGYDAEAHAALALDGIRLIATALQQSVSPDGVAEKLREIQDVACVTGTASFGTDRILRRPAFVVRQEGRTTTLLRRVSP